jgi:hypothetical protein
MPKTLFLGNGVNRLFGDIAWKHLLEGLAASVNAHDVLTQVDFKPFALVYEEITFRSNVTSRAQENALKGQIAALLVQLNVNEYHTRLVEAVETHIITTNYDYNLEVSCGSEGEVADSALESRYSVFRRRRTANDRFVWHVHGEASRPETIVLGYDHYSGQLQKLRDYATADRQSKRTIKSPFKMRDLRFEDSERPYSWIDVFFRDDVHIVGLGLDYTEIDLWWLLAYKRRLSQMSAYGTGKTVFHNITSGIESDAARAKVAILDSFGVDVISHPVADDYTKAYDRILEMLAEK